nr:short-chain type dehydrogenase/reductase-like [Ipomoea batatas]
MNNGNSIPPAAAETPISTPLLTVKPNCGLTHPDFVPNEVLNIIDTVTPMEPALDKVSHFLSSQAVASVIREQRKPELGFQFFIWTTNKKHFCSWDSHNLIIDMHAKVGHFDLYWKTLEEVKNFAMPICSDAFAVLISAYWKLNKAEMAVECFGRMKDFNCKANPFTYNVILHVMAKRIDDACTLFNLMKTRGCSADFVTYNVLLNGFCKLGRVDEALALLKSFRSEGYVVGLEGYSCLIDDLVRAKRISEAHSLSTAAALMAEGSSVVRPSSPALPLKDRVAIVTGSSRGIGKAIAIQLASLGAKLVVNYTTNSDQANAVVSELNSSADSPRAIAVRADVSDPAQVKALFDAAESAFNSPVHILVNSAGVLDAKYPSLADTAIEDFDKTFNINTRGAFVCCKEAANRITRGGAGRIICLTSSTTAALRPGFAAYAASKAAVEAMVKILAKELKGTGITANCVAPGPVATEMFFEGKSEEVIQKVIDESPLCRLGTTEDIAPVVAFLAGDGGGWVNGQTIRVNGGYV